MNKINFIFNCILANSAGKLQLASNARSLLFSQKLMSVKPNVLIIKFG